jgi:hypothetical protein
VTDVRINDWRAFGGDGSEGFTIETLKGLGGVGVKSDDVPRPQAHGEFDVPVFRTARVVTIAGLCLSSSPKRMQEHEDHFTGLLADGNASRVMFDLPTGTRWGMGRLADTPEFDSVIWGSISEYMLQLKFADPRLYGTSRATQDGTPKPFVSGEKSFHRGNFPAIPTHVISGNRVGGYTVSGPAGKKFIVSATLTGGSPHTIDRSGGLFIDGVQVFGKVLQADTWTIPHGTEVVQSVDNGLSLATTVVDTFL